MAAKKTSGARLVPAKKRNARSETARNGPRFQAASDQSLLIYFGEKITRKANERIRKLLHLLEAERIAGIRNLHPAYCSLLVKFDPLRWQHQKLEKELRKYLGRLDNVRLPEPRQV